jgi:hypothetical protein
MGIMCEIMREMEDDEENQTGINKEKLQDIPKSKFTEEEIIVRV